MERINSAFVRLAALLPGALAGTDGKDREERIAAFDAFREGGLPHRKVEAWKYTDLTAAMAGPFQRPPQAPLYAIFPDAVQQRELADYPGVGKDQPLALLSRALSHGGLELAIPAGVEVKQLIEINLPPAGIHEVVCPALVVRVGAGSRADILIRASGRDADSLVSSLIRVEVEEQASVSLTKLCMGGGANFCNLQTRQAAASRLFLFEATIGGRLTRNDLHTVLEGEGAEIVLDGLYVASGGEHVDNHTTVVHAVPNTRSRQLYKGIIDGAACGVFNGRIVVNPGAKGTDALQLNRNLLCRRTASVDTKPQLEIGNDDVRCTHGATIGRLDEAQIFYLKSRGLDPRAAAALLSRGFAGEVIDRIRHPEVREVLRCAARDFFDHKEAEGEHEPAG